jgi:AraC-like DNA-binding protein
MSFNQVKFEKLVALMAQHAPLEGPNIAPSGNYGTFMATSAHSKTPAIDLPTIFVVGQGRKFCYCGDLKHEYSAGKVIGMFYPMSVEAEYVEASPETPFLAAGVELNLGRMADVLLRIDRIGGSIAKPKSIDPSGIFTIPLSDPLLDLFIKLLNSLSDALDSAFLSDSIIDEIYYRLLTGEKGGELQCLIQQRGEIQRIAKAVAHIHRNLDQPVSVEKLAEMVHMGQTTFYENFRRVMHVSPLQYAKSVKLDAAQRHIQQGKKANEAAYMVGYNSPAQFSREYKRHFGFVPSATEN